MKMFQDIQQIYLHRQPVDFRKSINGLALIVEQQMALSPFSDAIFVFCNRQHDKIKVLYWDSTGFCLWYKRLEKAAFHWPTRMAGEPLTLTEQQWHWLLQGYNISQMRPHPRVEACGLG
jgi:transposase